MNVSKAFAFNPLHPLLFGRFTMFWCGGGSAHIVALVPTLGSCFPFLSSCVFNVLRLHALLVYDVVFDLVRRCQPLASFLGCCSLVNNIPNLFSIVKHFLIIFSIFLLRFQTLCLQGFGRGSVPAFGVGLYLLFIHVVVFLLFIANL